MKKLITTVFFALLLLLVIPPALEGPVRSLLSALGAPTAHSRAIALALTGLGIFLFLDSGGGSEGRNGANGKDCAAAMS